MINSSRPFFITISPFYHITCVSCGTRFQESETITRCTQCHEALDITLDMGYLRKNLNIYALKNTPISAMKYLDFYPLVDRSLIVSLGEGATPLVSAQKLGEKYGVPNLFIKNEGMNPTGVFKDRGSLVEITKAKELGATGIVVASTGNMAASVSAYSARAEIPCFVLVPEGTPIGKLSQSLAYGGKILSIHGDYGDCVRLSEEMAEKYGFLLAGDYAFRAEGQKSIAYEIIEQLFWQVPDVVVIPMGCGTNLAGIAKGFFEWYKLGLIDKIPRIIGVQPEKSAVITAGFEAGLDTSIPLEKPGSLCSAVNIGAPLDDRKAISAIRESHGTVGVIDDDSTLRAQKDMATLASVFTEPSGAIPVAVLPKLLEEGKILSTDTVVCIATGIGLKDPKSATLLFSELPSLNPTLEEIDAYLKSGISDIRSAKKKEEVLFDRLPSPEKLKTTLKNFFSFAPEKNPELFEYLYDELSQFFERKSTIKNSEFQILLEDMIADFHVKSTSILELKDFSITNGLRQKAQASVTVLFDGEEMSATGSGVGPVDASITALKKAISKKNSFEIFLKDYLVRVPSDGVDVSVIARILAEDDQGNSVRTRSTSPDIVIASLQAYIKAFCRLWEERKSL